MSKTQRNHYCVKELVYLLQNLADLHEFWVHFSHQISFNFNIVIEEYKVFMKTDHKLLLRRLYSYKRPAIMQHSRPSCILRYTTTRLRLVLYILIDNMACLLYPIYSWIFYLNFQLEFSTWIFNLNCLPEFSTWIFYLDFQLEFSTWIFNLKYIVYFYIVCCMLYNIFIYKLFIVNYTFILLSWDRTVWCEKVCTRSCQRTLLQLVSLVSIFIRVCIII